MKMLKFNVPAWAGAAIVALAIAGGLAACSDQGVSPVEVQQEQQRVQPVGPAFNGGATQQDTTKLPLGGSGATTQGDTTGRCSGGTVGSGTRTCDPI